MVVVYNCRILCMCDDIIEHTKHNEISSILKKISFDKVKREWNILSKMTLDELEAVGGRSKLGCDVVDYYFFAERLHTIGNKGINFFDFLRDIEDYKKKHYIQTLITFCEKNNRYKDSLLKRYYYIYGLCFGRINAFKITNALYIYKKYGCQRVIDPFCGFGGRLIAATMLNIEYRGMDINHNLKSLYTQMINDLVNEDNKEKVSMEVIDSETVDFVQYSKLYAYDMVCTSPPYKNIEIYRCSSKRTNEEWSNFYRQIFLSLWTGLSSGGFFIININGDIYESILVKMFGECQEKFLLVKTKKNSYDEYVYIWKK